MSTPKTRLYLVRHAEVEVRYHRVFGGRIDMELSPQGHEQAQALANFFAGRVMDAVYASPMRRVRQTLEPFAGHSRSAPVIMDGLREVDFGAWTGLSWEEVFQKHRVSAFDWLAQLDQSAIETAECPKAWRSRVESCLSQILAQHRAQSVGIVCHGGVIRMLLSILLDLPLTKTSGFDVEYASVTCVDYAPSKTTIRWLNHTPWRDLT